MPAAPMWCFGHHFSSIAGAGPINAPIQAAIFGWVPVLLWVLIGGIFFGATHDFSGRCSPLIRHKGQTLATVIAQNIDGTGQSRFCIFAHSDAYLVVAWPASYRGGHLRRVAGAVGRLTAQGGRG
ncbi:MAG: carbon starvation CstA family protein [Adlercreutzia equolifaciens]